MDAIAHKEDYVINSGSLYPENPGTTNISVVLDIDWQQNYDHCCVSSLSIPKTFWVIPVDATIVLTEDKSVANIVVQSGNYNVNSMSLVLSELLTNGSPLGCIYVVSYPDDFIEANKVIFTFTVTGNSGVQPVITTTDRFLASTLGIYPSTEYQFSGDIFRSIKVMNFQAYDELLIKSDMVENRSNLLQEVYTTGNPYNSSIVWHCPDITLYSKKIRKTAGNIYHFSIQTVDGESVDLHGSSWSFVLSIFRFDDTNRMIREYIRYRAELDAQRFPDT